MIRIFPTVNALILKNQEPSNLLAYSVACMLRFLTPISISNNGLFTGKLPYSTQTENKDTTFFYGSNLKVNFELGEYQFRNDFDPSIPNKLLSISNEFSVDMDDKNEIFNLLVNDVFKFKDHTNIHLTSWLKNVNFWYFYILKEERKSSHLELLSKAIHSAIG